MRTKPHYFAAWFAVAALRRLIPLYAPSIASLTSPEERSARRHAAHGNAHLWIIAIRYCPRPTSAAIPLSALPPALYSCAPSP